MVEDWYSYLGWIFDSASYRFGQYNYGGDDYYSYDWTYNTGSITGHSAHAKAPGIVIYTGTCCGYSGNHVIIQCLDNPRFAYLYSNLQDINVAIGDIVGFNTLIGHVGNYSLHDVLYQKITKTDDPSFSNLLSGYSPSRTLTGSPTIYAARFYDLFPIIYQCFRAEIQEE
ncbi:MAG: peptidoglycan DD-metalloendopeptidase family protein [Candidatus Omnitrophota bacterium]